MNRKCGYAAAIAAVLFCSVVIHAQDRKDDNPYMAIAAELRRKLDAQQQAWDAAVRAYPEVKEYVDGVIEREREDARRAGDTRSTTTFFGGLGLGLLAALGCGALAYGGGYARGRASHGGFHLGDPELRSLKKQVAKAELKNRLSELEKAGEPKG